MSPYSTVAFLAMGVALTALPRPAMRRLVVVSASLTSMIGAVSLLGYIWNATELTSDQWLPPVAINTALAFILIGAGIALACCGTTPRAAVEGRPIKVQVENKVLVGFMAALALLFLGGGITYRMGVEFTKSAQSITHTQQIRAALKDLYVSIADSESAQRKYLLIGSPDYRAEYQALAKLVDSQIEALRQLISDDPVQRARLHDLAPLIAMRMQLLSTHVEVFERLGNEAVRSKIATDNGVAAMTTIRATIYQMDRIADQTLTARAKDFARQRSETLIALLATLAVATATLVLLFGSITADIRERARITKALDQAQRAALRATQAKSDFLAAMSHEIRTPMNGVIGMLDVLHQSSLVAPQEEMVTLIRESADSLLTIIDDILDFSKIEAGRLDIESLPLSVADVVEKTCVLLNRLAERKGGTLMVFADPAIPRTLLGDAARLRQILINLTNHAIKFSSGLSHPGQVSLRAVLAARHSDHVVVEFRVTDNGIGMDEATLRRLFTSFTQADVSTTRRYGGTGLGLAISKQLTNLMGGDITVTTAVNQGSTFTVHLPFALALQHADCAEVDSDISGLTCLVIGE
jgi:signal transduction histidine kinase